MHNLATTGAAKRRREQLGRAFQRRRDEQTKGALGLGPACETGDVVRGPRNQQADREPGRAGTEVLRGLLTVTQTLTELVTVLCQREQREQERAMQANSAFLSNVANPCGTAGPVNAACSGDVSRRSPCEWPEHPPGLFWPQDEGTGSCALSAMGWRSPAARRDAATQAGGSGLLCAEGPCSEGRALIDMQAGSPVSYEVAVQTDDRLDNPPPGDAFLLEANNHGERAGISCRLRDAISTVLGMPDEQVYAHAQVTGDGTMILEKGYDRMRQEICSLAAKKQGFQLLEWSLRRLKTSVAATCFLAWRLHTEGSITLRQRSTSEEVRVSEQRTRAVGARCFHEWRLLAEGARTTTAESTCFLAWRLLVRSMLQTQLVEIRQRGLEPDVVAHAAVINACEKSGHTEQAIEVVGAMRREGLEPQETACISLDHAGGQTDKTEQVTCRDSFLHGLSKDAASSETLFVKNLPLDTTSEGAQVIFGQHGSVTSCMVLPVAPGKAGRAAFVTMSKVDEAKWIVENVNGTCPQGLLNPVNVIFATPRRKGRDRPPCDVPFVVPAGKGRGGGGETALLTHAGSNRIGGGASVGKLTWRPKLHASADFVYLG